MTYSPVLINPDSWLARELPLHEQSVKDDEVLVFGRSFFGENIDQVRHEHNLLLTPF